MRPALLALVLLAAAVFVPACQKEKPPPPGQLFLSGTVTYADKMAISKDAIVDIALRDVTQADAPSKTVAIERFAAKDQVPIPFQLAYDPGRIDPLRRYALEATISVNAKVLFSTTSPVPVLTQGARDSDVVVTVTRTP
ncbi:MAG: YbaY family lipoprotein [Phycisphaeraceae bacterium]|nr:YbaY family lipoprotein [Phycisphaeraceae bacterium]